MLIWTGKCGSCFYWSWAGAFRLLHPLYTDKDLIFDSALLGESTQNDGKGTWVFTKTGEKEYRLVFIDDKGKRGGFGSLAENREPIILGHFPHNRI